MRRLPAATAATAVTKQFASGGCDEELARRRYRLHGDRSRRHKTATRRHRPQLLQPSVSCPSNQCRAGWGWRGVRFFYCNYYIIIYTRPIVYIIIIIIIIPSLLFLLLHLLLLLYILYFSENLVILFYSVAYIKSLGYNTSRVEITIFFYSSMID